MFDHAPETSVHDEEIDCEPMQRGTYAVSEGERGGGGEGDEGGRTEHNKEMPDGVVDGSADAPDEEDDASDVGCPTSDEEIDR
jgi:hypothetical protein